MRSCRKREEEIQAGVTIDKVGVEVVSGLRHVQYFFFGWGVQCDHSVEGMSHNRKKRKCFHDYRHKRSACTNI